MTDMPSAIVIGATSGIGRALAVEFARRGFAVGVTGRRAELLQELDDEIKTPTIVKPMDIRRVREAMETLRELIDEMADVDVIVINAGVGSGDGGWGGIEAMIDTNVTGFVAVAEASMDYFSRRKGGHLVGISSIAGLRGAKRAPVYNASKAFVSIYMEGLRHRVASEGLPIHITDIRPGFVGTVMIEGRPGLLWVASPEKAAGQIFEAIQKKKKHAYITKRWRLVAWLARVVPDWIYHKL